MDVLALRRLHLQARVWALSKVIDNATKSLGRRAKHGQLGGRRDRTRICLVSQAAAVLTAQAAPYIGRSRTSGGGVMTRLECLAVLPRTVCVLPGPFIPPY